MKINPSHTGQHIGSSGQADATPGSPPRTETLGSRASSSTTRVRSASLLPGSTSATPVTPRDWGARAAHIRSVSVKQEDGSKSQVMLWLPQGMLDHPLRNDRALSGEARADEVKKQLNKVPVEATVRQDGSGDIKWDLGGNGRLDVVFAPGGQITSLLLRTGSQTLQLGDQAWLRGALRDAGKTVPAGASLWRVPGGEPVACDPALPPLTKQLPPAFKEATANAGMDDLFQHALDALCEGSARQHRSKSDGRAQFEFEVFGQVLSAEYEHADHAVQSLKLSWQPPSSEGEKQPLAQWGGLDAELLALTTQTGGKRKRPQDTDYSSDEGGDTQRRLTTVTGHATEIINVAGIGDEMDFMLDQLLGSSQPTTPDQESSTSRSAIVVTRDKGKRLEIRAGGSGESSPTSPASAMSVGSSRVDLQACKLEYSIVSPK